MLRLNGREVINAEVDGVHRDDYPDFCDAFFSYAEWADTGEPLTEQCLDRLTEENGDVLNEMAHESYRG